jgi:hypothetical protein
MSIAQASREPLRNAVFVYARLFFLSPTSPGDAVSFVVLCCPSVVCSICNSVHLHASRVVTTEAGRVKLDKQALLGHSISGEDPKVRVTVGRKGFFWFRFKENAIPLVEVSGFDYAPALEFVCQMCATVFCLWRCDIACTSFAQQQVDWVVVSTLRGSGWCGRGDTASNSSDADRRGGNSSSDSSSFNGSDNSSSSSTGLAHRRG